MTITEIKEPDPNCFDISCKNHVMYRELSTSFEYISHELDYIISENQPVIKGRQSLFGIGKGSWLTLACALNNPKNYDSVSIILNEKY